MQRYMATLKDSADSCGKLFAASCALIQLLAGKLIGLDVTAVRATAAFMVFTPALQLQKSNTDFIVGKLLLYGEDVHMYSVLPL